MKLPIYSNLKAKLESKGLDSTTSGQIAWLGFSGVIGVKYVALLLRYYLLWILLVYFFLYF
ncbi:hypothetical protein [Helicobacter trogontum]|uniref:hypothetical protein n=1 Tax=Helicobacter trogontum TaxID=50960 RepID=UPI000A80D782|nr:hypothetical protein [Helicobacter trogontum]